MQFQYKQVKMFPTSRGVETPPPTVRWFKPPDKLKFETGMASAMPVFGIAGRFR